MPKIEIAIASALAFGVVLYLISLSTGPNEEDSDESDS